MNQRPKILINDEIIQRWKAETEQSFDYVADQICSISWGSQSKVETKKG